jgi:hypothetical protein
MKQSRKPLPKTALQGKHGKDKIMRKQKRVPIASKTGSRIKRGKSTLLGRLQVTVAEDIQGIKNILQEDSPRV